MIELLEKARAISGRDIKPGSSVHKLPAGAVYVIIQPGEATPLVVTDAGMFATASVNLLDGN